MPISEYLKGLRSKIGHDLLLGPAVAAVIRNEARDVLVHQRRDNGVWELPAGGVDPGEAPAQAVVREVYEETGLRVRPVRLLGVFGGTTVVHPNGDETQPYCTLFECEVVGGSSSLMMGKLWRSDMFHLPKCHDSSSRRRKSLRPT